MAIQEITVIEPQDRETRVPAFRKHVQQYGRAAEHVEKGKSLSPTVQVFGHWLELALKMYMEAAHVQKRGHNLVKLARKAEELDLQLTQRDYHRSIEKLNKVYFANGRWSSKYLSRYPDFYATMRAVAIPGYVNMRKLIDRIVDQAETRLNMS